MTNKEAIIEMQLLKKAYCNTHTDAQLKKNREVLDAYDLAIKALEQQHCEDAISRQVVLEFIGKQIDHSLWAFEKLVNGIKALPSVTQKLGKWIPISKRLPEKSGEYWCTFGGTNLTGSDYYTTKSDAKRIFDDPEEYAGWRSQNVIAWMPLPEPYMAESEE